MGINNKGNMTKEINQLKMILVEKSELVNRLRYVHRMILQWPLIKNKVKNLVYFRKMGIISIYQM